MHLIPLICGLRIFFLFDLLNIHWLVVWFSFCWLTFTYWPYTSSSWVSVLSFGFM